MVLKCIDKGISLDELSLEEYKEISPVFEQDIYEAISMKTCVEKRMTLGAPGPDVMEQVIAGNKKYLEANCRKPFSNMLWAVRWKVTKESCFTGFFW